MDELQRQLAQMVSRMARLEEQQVLLLARFGQLRDAVLVTETDLDALDAAVAADISANRYGRGDPSVHAQ